MYLMLLFIGSLGFISMTLLGFLHGGGSAKAGSHPLSGHSHALGGHSHAMGGHVHSAAPVVHHGHAGTHHAAHPVSTEGNQGPALARSNLLMNLFVISPLDVFSFAIGAGAIGVACKNLLPATPLALSAILGAVVFNYGVIKPIMANLLKFGTTPSTGLEGMIAQTGTALTTFDSCGRGLVQLKMDGQLIQLLASIDNAELHRGVHVHKGDEVVVIEVDGQKNTCRVTRELAE